MVPGDHDQWCDGPKVQQGLVHQCDGLGPRRRSLVQVTGDQDQLGTFGACHLADLGEDRPVLVDP